jgi:hypothetical protein
MRVHLAGRERQHGAVNLDRRREMPELRFRKTEIVVCVGEIGLEPRRRAEMFHRFGVAPGLAQRVGEVEMRVGEVWVPRKRLPEGGEGRVAVAGLVAGDAQQVGRRRIAR